MEVQFLVFVFSFLHVALAQDPTFAFNMDSLTVSVAPTRTVSDIELVKTGTHDNDITVVLQVVPGTAIEGTDFTVPELQFTFSSDTQSLPVPFTVMDSDSEGEAGEDFELSIVGSSESVTITLLDDDATIVGYKQPGYTVTEGGDIVQVCAGFRGTFTIADGNFIEAAVSIIPVLAGTESRITTTEIDNGGFPFTISATPQTLTIADFEGVRQHCFNVTAVNNGVVDGNVFFNLSFVPVGTTLDNLLPVQLENTMPTIVVLDDDRNTFTVMLESGDTGSDPIVAREGSAPFTIPQVLRRGGFPTDLTYLVTLTTPDNTDFVFNPMSFPPTSDTTQLRLTLINDNVPEPKKTFNITIGDVEIGENREGLQAQWSGFALVDVYDNDFAIGFSDSDVMISEGSTRTLSLSILDPTGDNVDPLASFPLTLQLQRVDDPSGATLVTLDSTNVDLSASSPSTSIQLTAGNDDLCSSDHRYRLSYTYTGSEAYTVLTNRKGEVNLQLVDDVDCADPTTPEPTQAPTTEPAAPESTQAPTTEPAAPESTQAPTTPKGVGATTEDSGATDNIGAATTEATRKVCIPCIVVPIVLILVLCCCFWWILILICLLCKKRCKWYHDYNPQKKERAYENVYKSGTMVPLSEKEMENGKTT